MVIESDLTLITDDVLYFRGVDATELCRTRSFESVAAWLWTASWPETPRLVAPELPADLRAAMSGMALPDRMRVALAAASSADPLRYDLSATTVVAAASRMLPLLVSSLSDRPPPRRASVPRQLWPALTNVRPNAQDATALNAALVLLIDHDLAVSTLAARIAASARAHPYAVVAAGLAATEGLLHGAASAHAHRLLHAITDGEDPKRLVHQLLRSGGHVPGFGHRIYRRRDPRAQTLLELLGASRRYRAAVTAARELEDVLAPARLFPNVDLALAVLSVGARMAPAAGEAVFAIARTVGWIAHALEEYELPGLRLRPIGRYTGPDPSTSR